MILFWTHSFLKQRTWYILRLAFFTWFPTWMFHLRLFWMVTPRYLQDSTRLTFEPDRIIGCLLFGFFLKSNIISIVLVTFRSRWLSQHQLDTWDITCLSSDSSLSLMRPSTIVSSAYFIILHLSVLQARVLVYRINRQAERTHPWGAPVLIVRMEDCSVSVLTRCFRSVRKSRTRSWSLAGTLYSAYLSMRMCGCIVLKAEEQSMKRQRAKFDLVLDAA